MWVLLRMWLGQFLARLVSNYVDALRQARADDPSVFDFVKVKVAKAEALLGPGKGPEKQDLVDVDTKQYVATLGKEIATVGIHALTISAMQELGLVAAHFAEPQGGTE